MMHIKLNQAGMKSLSYESSWKTTVKNSCVTLKFLYLFKLKLKPIASEVKKFTGRCCMTQTYKHKQKNKHKNINIKNTISLILLAGHIQSSFGYFITSKSIQSKTYVIIVR